MIIILKKDGQIVTDDGNPVEGVKLENAAAILADPKDGDTIVYDANAGMWVAGTGGGSFEPDITNPQDGDTLVYDASEEKWVNGSGGGGSGGGYLAVHANNGTLDKTWKEIYDAFVEGKYVSEIYEEESLDDGTETYQYQIQMCIVTTGGEYVVSTSNNNYSTDSENGYPAVQGGGGDIG